MFLPNPLALSRGNRNWGSLLKDDSEVGIVRGSSIANQRNRAVKEEE